MPDCGLPNYSKGELRCKVPAVISSNSSQVTDMDPISKFQELPFHVILGDIDTVFKIFKNFVRRRQLFPTVPNILRLNMLYFTKIYFKRKDGIFLSTFTVMQSLKIIGTSKNPEIMTMRGSQVLLK